MRDLEKGKIDREDFQASLNGWINHASYGDTWGLRRAILESVDLYGGVLGE
ncbi:MAG: hypothetical protein ACTSXL_01310 [Alphaproteobacteria bacterium]